MDDQRAHRDYTAFRDQTIDGLPRRHFALDAFVREHSDIVGSGQHA